MLKKILVLLIGCLLTTIGYAANTATLVIDAIDRPGLPNNFLTTANVPNLSNLHAVSSAQFSEVGLLTVMEELKAPLWIVDLRQEAHGFVDGTAVSWYGKRDWANLGKTPEQVETEQQQLLAKLSDQEALTLNKMIGENHKDPIVQVQPVEFDVDNVLSELELTKLHHVGYTRLYVTAGILPTDVQIDRFIQLVRSLPANTWLYFHGRLGQDRPVLFMALYDMMKNAKQASFETILQRQSLLSGVNLADIPTQQKYQNTYQSQRLEFLRKFYQYCRMNNDGFMTTWSISHS